MRLLVQAALASVLLTACEQNGGTDLKRLSVTVLTDEASGITETGATLNASWTDANATVREAGFEWGSSSENLTETAQAEFDGTPGKAGEMEVTINGLGAGKTYWFRAYVILQRDSEIKTFYGRAASFQTRTTPDQPVSTTQLGWYELPVMNIQKDGAYLKNASDESQYYAYHLCTGGEKGPGGRTARNYTVCYSATHHCPVWVAAPRHSMYVGGSGRNDAYRKDPDIPADIQYSSKSVGSSSGCNKGHMLGSEERTSSKATNQDVFYYTNIAPQLSANFNTGGGRWNDLEDWVDMQVCSDTLYVVIGCGFDSYTDKYGQSASPKVISYCGRNDVSQPTFFYYVLLRTKKGNSGKALKDCSADEIACAAMVRAHVNVRQDVSTKEMMSVSDLERITGITYFANLPQAPKGNFNTSDWKW